MPKVTHTTILHQPVETVFAALTNFEHTPNWQPEVIKEWHTLEGPIQDFQNRSIVVLSFYQIKAILYHLATSNFMIVF